MRVCVHIFLSAFLSFDVLKILTIIIEEVLAGTANLKEDRTNPNACHCLATSLKFPILSLLRHEILGGIVTL
jgi:hypothetical protein